MALPGKLGGWVRALMVERLLERPVRHQGLAAQLAGLERAGKKLEARLQKAASTPKDREVLRHIIGIERWGQRRLGLVVGGKRFQLRRSVTRTERINRPPKALGTRSSRRLQRRARKR